MWKKCLILFIVLTHLSCSRNEPITIPTIQTKTTSTIEDRFMDKSILTGEPCEAPCWYGLEIDESTMPEAEAVIPTLSFIEPGNYSEAPWSYWDQTREELILSKLLQFKCKHPKNNNCVSLEFVGGELKSIQLYPNYYLSFQEVVERFGPPKYVQLFPIRGKSKKCDITLEWTDIYIEIYSRAVGEEDCLMVKEGQGVPPDLPVDEISYGSPDDVTFLKTPDPKGDFPWIGFTEK